MTHWLVVQE